MPTFLHVFVLISYPFTVCRFFIQNIFVFFPFLAVLLLILVVIYARSLQLLGDIAACLQAAYAKEKGNLVTWLLEVYFPSQGVPASSSQQFCNELATSLSSSDDTNNKKKLKDFLKVCSYCYADIIWPKQCLFRVGLV